MLSNPIGTAQPAISLAAGARIDDNSAGSNGGGIFALGGTVDATGSGTAPVLLAGNTAGASGGGLYLSAGATARLDTTRVLRNQATTDGGGIWMASTATSVLELSNCGAAFLAFERYCNEFTANTAGGNGGAIMNAGGTLFVEQAGFSANSAGNGNHAIATSGSATARIEASIFLAHPPSGGNAVATFAGATTATLRAVTFASGAAFAFDADNTATIRVDRVLTTAPIYTGSTPYAGACNLTSADGYEPFGNAEVILANPSFVTTANSDYVPSDASAIDACTSLGRFSDIADQGPIDTDGTPDSRDHEIGAWSSSGPITCDGAAVTINLNTPNPPAPTAGADVILGTPGPDIISGLGGNDRICSGHGDDTIVGGTGADVILGGPGNDTIDSVDGTADQVSGNAGTDSCRRDIGIDSVFLCEILTS